MAVWVSLGCFVWGAVLSGGCDWNGYYLYRHCSGIVFDAISPCSSISGIHCPSSIIGDITSYQYQKSYAYFSRVSRKVFVDCNSPNRLKLLKLHTVPVGARVNLQRYSRITHCEFSLGGFNPFAVGDDQIFANCRDLRSLCIRGDGGDIAILRPSLITNHRAFRSSKSYI